MRTKAFRLLGAVVALTVGVLVAFPSQASAQSAEDIQQLIDNAPAAAEELAAGLEEAVNTLAETQSLVETFGVLGQTIVATGSTLVAGTEQFGALGTGLLLMDLALQNLVGPYLGAIDDPTTAPGLFDPNDANEIAANLQPFLENAQQSLSDGLVFLLQGNIIEPPLGLGPAFWSSAVVGTLLHAFESFQGTILQSPIQTLGITSLVLGAALEPQISELEAALAPVFEAAAPVTDQVIAIIQGL